MQVLATFLHFSVPTISFLFRSMWAFPAAVLEPPSNTVTVTLLRANECINT